MANVTSSLQATISSVDINNRQVIRDIGSPQLQGNTGDLVTYRTAMDLLPMALPIIVSPIQCIYIKNLAPAAGGTILIKAVPSGGVEQILGTISPGGVLIIWNTASSLVTGYAGVSVTASAIGVVFEYYFGG